MTTAGRQGVHPKALRMTFFVVADHALIREGVLADVGKESFDLHTKDVVLILLRTARRFELGEEAIGQRRRPPRQMKKGQEVRYAQEAVCR